jgi:hypothetical protein
MRDLYDFRAKSAIVALYAEQCRGRCRPLPALALTNHPRSFYHALAVVVR